jgi:putative ABC transport system substrate-binding protein
MRRLLMNLFLKSCSDNRNPVLSEIEESNPCPFDKLRADSELCRRIENPKWLGFAVITFVLLVAGAMAQAQRPKKTPRIGFMVPSSATAYATRIEAFRSGLRDLGYIEGKNIAIEYRYADGNVDVRPQLFAELVRLNVDIIVTNATENVLTAKKATKTIPIVFATAGDPVASGIVESLARPGGNLTGLSLQSPEVGGKRLELLKETVPGISRVAVILWHSKSVGTSLQLKEIEVAAPPLGLKLFPVEVAGPALEHLGIAFSAITKVHPNALIGLLNPSFAAHRGRIAEFAVKNRLPAMQGDRTFPESGGIVSYGPDNTDLFRRAAVYVDKILKGAKPADLPVEQPTKFEFIINLKTAKQIGLTIPPNVLARADRVIR